jgi:hypothetical protein
MDIQRRRFLRLVSLGILGASATLGFGCGSGSGGNNGTNNGGGNGGGGGATNPNVTDEAVYETRQALTNHLNSLPGNSDLATKQQSVLNFLRGRPEVAAAGTADGGAWAVFGNGWVHLVFLNRRINETPDDSGLPPADGSRAAGTAVPSGERALFLNAMGTGFLPEGSRVQPAIAAGGYQINNGDASLESLRNLGTPPSFFFLSSHGLAATVDAPQLDGSTRQMNVFALSTSTVATKDMDKALKADQAAGLVFSGNLVTSIVNNVAVWGDVYVITQEWVKKFWRFAPNSLVWISACSSSSGGAASLIQAFFAAGAGAYAGYTDYVESPQSDRMQRFVIDRLVGANVLNPKEETPQRAFDYDKVVAEMTQRIGNAFPVHNDDGTPAGRTVSLRITQNGTSEFGLLAPSIAYVLVDEANSKAILKGTFGLETTDGKVFIGGQEAAVEVWGRDEIQCHLNDSGDGSAGDVQVVVRNHKSNIRRITRYTIQGSYRFRPDDDKPHIIEGNMNLQFRVDVGEYRENPGIVFVRPTRTATLTHQSEAGLTAKGIYVEACSEGRTSTETWAGEQTLVPFDSKHPIQGVGLIGYIKLDTINKTGALSVTFGLDGPYQSPFKNTAKDCDGQQLTLPIAPAPPTPIENVISFPSPVDPENLPALPLLGTTFDMSGDWGIPGGSMNNDLGASFQWNAAQVEFAPDPQAARSRK